MLTVVSSLCIVATLSVKCKTFTKNKCATCLWKSWDSDSNSELYIYSNIPHRFLKKGGEKGREQKTSTIKCSRKMPQVCVSIFLKKKLIYKNNFLKKQNTDPNGNPSVRLETTASRIHSETAVCRGRIFLYGSEGRSPRTGDL